MERSVLEYIDLVIPDHKVKNEELLMRYRAGEEFLKNYIVEKNLGLINYVLKGFRWAFNDNPNYQNVFDKEDLFQEGVLGLYASLDKYDPELGAFSTHAISYIKQAIYRFYYDKGRVIRIPIWCFGEFNKLKKAEGKYIIAFKKEPSLKQLSKFSGIPTDKILELRRSFSSVSSIDKPFEAEDGDIDLSDTIPDNTDFYTESERRIIMPALKEDLDRMIQDKIPVKHEAMAFKNYFKYKDKKAAKLIAEEHGMSVAKLNRVINKGIIGISIRYQDELIEKYADLISSSIRKEREEELLGIGIQNVIHEVVACSLKSGDSLTIINKEGEMVQATVWKVDSRRIKYDFIYFNEIIGEYEQRTSSIWIEYIYDYRTENKKVVEIRVRSTIGRP